jgi:hypothetical protein
MFDGIGGTGERSIKMTAFREPGFKERQEAAAKAKQAALDKLRARSNPGKPAVVQRQVEPLTTTVERTGAKKARTAAQKPASKPAKKEARSAAPAAKQKPAPDKRDAPRKGRSK